MVNYTSPMDPMGMSLMLTIGFHPPLELWKDPP